MGRITYLRFAFSLFTRDWITSALHVVFSAFFGYGFVYGFFAARTEKISSDLSSIELFLKSPYLVLCLSGLAFIFMTIVRIMSRSGDNGIMMAVGGNRNGVVFLQTMEVWLIHGIGFVGSILISILLPFGNPELVSFLDYLGTILLEILLIGAIAGFTAFLYTLIDPYKSIRRGK
ncbi:ABC transporter permease [Leptospira langatensis]|uniref:ABC transporter permease n=1 Tax=Leptospira langatensis TaxID=2484983 RepID=A0A5F1ZSV5_9LEPT|nr:ABC transporter permease [Leptospira langatensis]TGK00232.1 ABC transporter permease [Leptospira langatensis]TGL41134.1 ABC transporter permease [Leptospira langatensis]